MTNDAMRAAFANLRDGEELATLEQAARSRSEADWLVGMNATRAATIRLRSSFDGAVSLGRVQTPTLAILDAARGGDPRVRAREVLARRREVRTDDDRRYEGRFHAGAQPRIKSAPRRRGDRRGRPRQARRDHQARQDAAHRARADALRPHVAAARRQHALRLLRPAHARRRPAPLRGAQGAHLSAHELALPDVATWSRTSSRPPSASATTTPTPRPRRT